MDPVLKIEVEPHLLVARFSGAIDVSFMIGQVGFILGECQNRKLDLLLIDFMGLEGTPFSTLDRYRMGTAILSAQGKVEKVANVTRPEFLDSERFGEKVAQNRGLNLRVFTLEKAAREWLLADSIS